MRLSVRTVRLLAELGDPKAARLLDWWNHHRGHAVWYSHGSMTMFYPSRHE